MARISLFVAVIFLGMRPRMGHGAETLPGTASLTMEGDLAARMVSGIDAYLDREIGQLGRTRAGHWHRDLSSATNYAKSIAPNRARLREIAGLVDTRDPVRLEFVDASRAVTVDRDRAKVGKGKGFDVFAVRWNVFRGVTGEGLLLVPDREPVAEMIAIPDCDWSPEMVAGLAPGLRTEDQFARRLAESGCQVLVPLLIDRSDTNSGIPGRRRVRHSQREFLWRAAYEMGRTMAGYEIHKVQAAVDWIRSGTRRLPLGMVGYGEGGLVAFYAAAVDERIDAVLVSGYFQPREGLANEPIYRNIWSLLERFGDAELASMVAPRALIIEAGKYPETEYPAPGQPHDGAAPGRLQRPTAGAVEAEFARAQSLVSGLPGARMNLVKGDANTVLSAASLQLLLTHLGAKPRLAEGGTLEPFGSGVDGKARMIRQYSQILEDTQQLMRESEFTRAKFWSSAKRTSGAQFAQDAEQQRTYFWDEIIGRLPKTDKAPNPRTRLIYETDRFKGYEVVLDVYDDVFAYGILLMPKGITAGERRPVVVCQHGLEGRPQDVANPSVDNPAYHKYAVRLAEEGFITFAPQNPYIGRNVFRQVLRKAQPLKQTLYGFIVRQHEVILDWLAGLDQVDEKRIAFYGLSYGGKTAMRIPPLLPRYCLSICSADYNEWIWKNVSAPHNYCYLWGGEYDMPEFNLGNTFNYAELSWLIFPRPFMVERGHDDGVAPDEWVAYEFAKTRRQYVKLGAGDNAQIEFFNGPHTINGKGTFEFLRRHLNWFPAGK